MGAAAVDKLLDAYGEAETLAEAEGALTALEARLDEAREVQLGDLYDNLAEVAADEGDFERAARAQAKALELGCEMPELGRQMLGWYLMRDGRREDGEAQFRLLLDDLGDDPETLTILGTARSDSGHERAALEAFDAALGAAKARADEFWIGRARVERLETRQDLGLPPDEDDREAMRPTGADSPAPKAVAFAIGWFPRSDIGAALLRWPDLEEDLADVDGYCAMVENRLRELATAAGRNPNVAPLDVDALLTFAAERGRDPADAATRASFAAEAHTRGETIEWPPGRNEPCWCRSGRKYKRCCGR